MTCNCNLNGGMALTAEQVEDVEALVATANPYSAPAARLRALFPATEPAEVSGNYCALCNSSPAPAEPAEEETKAEHNAAVGRRTDLGKRIESLFEQAEAGCDGTFHHDLGRALEDFLPTWGWMRQDASSPVVPAPTETGPWQDISEAPKHLTLIDRVGDKWTYDGDNWVTPETAILPVLYINRKYAPFVAAEEG